MNDYLGNLVIRSISPKGLVSPRPTSLFESARTVALSSAHYLRDLNREEDEREIDETVAAPVSQTAVRSPSPLFSTTNPRSFPNGPPSWPEHPSAAPPVQLAPDKETRPPVWARQNHQPPPPSPHHESPIQRNHDNNPPPVAAPIRQQTVIERIIQPATDSVSITEAKAAPSQEPPRTSEPLVPPVVVARTAEPMIPSVGDTPLTKPRLPNSTTASETPPPPEPLIQSVTVERILTPIQTADSSQSKEPHQPTPAPADPQPKREAIVTPPRLRPHIEPALPIPKPVSKPTPAPTIEVTIGRVEVRATPPMTPKPKKQPAQPLVMSLDEYLRQRVNGGGSL
jgi:hypothetical protein